MATAPAATGPLSGPTLPRNEGLEAFRGEFHHIAHWLREADGVGGEQTSAIVREGGLERPERRPARRLARPSAHSTVLRATSRNGRPVSTRGSLGILNTRSEMMLR